MDDGWALIDEEQYELDNKIKNIGVPLKKYVEGRIYRGVVTGFNEAFVVDEAVRKKIITDDPASHEIIKPFLVGQDIKRYQPPVSDKFVIFTRRGTDINSYPAIEKYLGQFKERLTPKPKGWDGGRWTGRKPGKYEWYEIQDTVDYYKEFEKVKILWPGISSEVTAFTIDEAGYYGNDNNQLIVTDDKYLLGVLNSRVMRFVLLNICDKVQGGFYRLKIIYIQQLPIRPINFSDPSDKARHDYVVERVEKMLNLYRQRQKIFSQFLKLLRTEFFLQKLSTKIQNWHDLDWTGFEKELKKAKVKLTLSQKSEWMEHFEQQQVKVSAIQQQIDRSDREIDRMVYELYGLSEEEIRIVEGT